ncbi:MAG: hypothetical protein AB1746_12060, partial [Candidatus Zixiibacteriota bacterium]
VFKLGLHFSELFNSWAMVGKLVLTIALLSSSFYFGGIGLAILFKKYHYEMPTMYMADLVGAGIGVALAVLTMNLWGTPAATFLCALPILLASLMAIRKWLKLLPLLLAAGAVFMTSYSEGLLAMERKEQAPIVYKHWDAMSKIKVYDYPSGYRGINIDNVANSPVYPFDGNWNKPDSELFQFGIDVGNLIKRFDSCTFLSLGSGGGVDVLQALQYGATEIHAVEVNPHINQMMLTGELAEYSGHIYDDPRVIVATEDARAYIQRFENKFDVIYSLSSNTWAALASGAFALAENYLFTTEAFEDYWRVLSDSGFMMMEHQFYMPRLVGEAMNALKRQGVEDVTAHFAVYDLPQMRRNIILLSKQPLTDEIRNNAFGEMTPEVYEYLHLLYPAPDSIKDNLINRIVINGWENEADSEVIDISPSTDNKPFVAQMGLWKNFTRENLEKILPYEFFGFPLSKIIIGIILLIVIAIIIPSNLIPYFKAGSKLRAAPWLYFFLIGMAFMSVEIILIQKYALFIGPSFYSIVAILLTLLVCSGIGSRFADRIPNTVPFIGIFIWILLDIFIFKNLFYQLDHLTILPRILITVLLICPLGFFMGMPFPKGTLRVKELIDWGFAVNGAASVLGSTLIVLVAFSWGFNVAMLLGAILYLLAFLLVSRKTAW